MTEGSIEVYEREARTFPPSADFAAAALVGDGSLHDEAEADFEAFWARRAPVNCSTGMTTSTPL